MKSIASLLVILSFYLAIPVEFSVANSNDGVRYHRIGGERVPGTNTWNFTSTRSTSSMFTRDFKITGLIARWDGKYVLVIQVHDLNDNVSDLELVLSNNHIIRCYRRNNHDQLLDGRRQQIYYLTDNEVQLLSRYDIREIFSTQFKRANTEPKQKRSFEDLAMLAINPELRKAREEAEKERNLRSTMLQSSNTNNTYKINLIREFRGDGGFIVVNVRPNTSKSVKTLIEHLER